MRKLGKNQESILRALVENRRWHAIGFGCGWIWSTPRETERLLDTLVKRGLAKRVLENGALVYRPTDEGKTHVEAAKATRLAAREASL